MAGTKVLEEKVSQGGNVEEDGQVIEEIEPGAVETDVTDADTPEITEETPKRPPGRPRADGVVGAAKTVVIDFPTPAYRTYRNDSNNPRQTSKAAYNYIGSLPTWAKNRGIAYVYRDWPILLPKNEDDYSYIDKVTPIDALTSDLDILQRYGCGSYRILLNDTELHKKVLTIWVVGLGGNDLKSNPPTDRRINSPGELDESRPENKVYISFLQGRGEAPEQINKKKEEEDMAQATVVGKLQDQNEKLLDRLIKKDEPSQQAATNNGAAVEVMKDAALKGQEAMLTTFQNALEMLKGLKGGESNGITIDQVVALVTTMSAQMGRAGADPAVMETVRALQAQVAQMQTARIEALERALEKAEERVVTRPAGQTGTLQEQLETLRGLKGIIDDIAGKSESNPVKEIAEDVAEAGGPWWLKPLMTTITSVVPAAASMYANYTANQNRGMGGPAPVPYPFPAPGAAPGGFPQPPGPIPFPGAPGPATAYQALPPGTQPAPAPAGPPQMTVAQLFDQIYTPLATHMLDPGMQDSERGTTFAAWFASGWEGEYEQLRKLGLETLTGEFMNHPRLGVLGQQQGPEKVGRFLKDFLEWEEGDGDDGGGGEVLPPAPTPIAS